VAIPKLRSGSYFPDWLLERRRRAERALTTVVATCYLLGVSTRRMEKLVESLGITRLSRSQVSVMARELDEQVQAFRTRPLDAGPYTFLASHVRATPVVAHHSAGRHRCGLLTGHRSQADPSRDPVRDGSGAATFSRSPCGGVHLGDSSRIRSEPVMVISADDSVVEAAAAAIYAGEVAIQRRLLAEHPWLATARIGDTAPNGMSRTLLHVATDWPGHFPDIAATVAALVEAGADVNARFRGPHEETPLHWAASSGDVEALDALLEAGSDIEAPGAVLGGGAPIADARGFKQWRAASRLVERGARTTLVDAATIGLLDRVEAYFTATAAPTPEEVTRAFWGACHGGRLAISEYLFHRGADLNWVPPWENLTPLDAAIRDGADELVRWLRERGATSAATPRR